MTEEPVVERGVLTASGTVWDAAVQRAEVIGRLAENSTVGVAAADEAAVELGVSRRQVYALVARWRAGEGMVSDLLPGRSSGGRGVGRLPDEVEAIVRTVLQKRFLTRQRRTVAAVHREITRECRVRGLPVPSRGTVLRRIEHLDPVKSVSAREGSDAARPLRSAGGVPPEITSLLEQVQIDHTPVDVIVVDERHRMPIGRPYVTAAIDVCSRCVVGLVVTLEAPSATSVGLCLAHMATDKRAWLERLGVEAVWPMSGKPRELYVDNAAEFKSEALRRGCDQHGIGLLYRPPGQPHFGGIVERLISTMMQLVHDELPGTMFSNTAQRGSYDSDGNAVLTMAELHAWLALAVACYHGQVHEGLGRTPAGAWAEQVTEHGAPVTVASETAFLVDFLPVIRRSLSRSGFQIDHVQYYCDALKPWIARRERLGKFVLRRDPRDISRIWALDPDGTAYQEVPYRTLSRPPISVWEQQAAVARLRELGRAEVDENALFAMVAQMREITDTAGGHHPQGPPRPATPVGDTDPPAPDGHDLTSTRAGHQRRCGRRGPAIRGDRAVVTDVDAGAGPVDLSHLHPAAQRIARLPNVERLRYVRADRWIGYTRATAALERLETLFAWPSKQRMPNLLLIGPTNNGKSMIIEKFRRAHPPISHEDREEIPVLVVQMPSEPSVSRFYTALLAALGAPMRARYRLAELEQLVLRLLRTAGVRTLVIDELHNVLGGRGDTRREFLNLLRFLGNELRIPLVGVGIRDAYLAIRSDDQLENRFAPLTLPRWEPDADACSLLASFAAAFPLRRPSPIANSDMASYLLTRSEGTIGELAHLLTDAAVAAIESGEEAINQRTLLMADYAGPTERRRLFERELA